MTSYLYPEYNKQLASLKRGLDNSFEGSNVRRGWRQHSNENDMKVMEDFDQVFGDHTITKRGEHYPANARRCFDVVITSFERYGRQ